MEGANLNGGHSFDGWVNGVARSEARAMGNNCAGAAGAGGGTRRTGETTRVRRMLVVGVVHGRRRGATE
jgi:hypothetical protein